MSDAENTKAIFAADGSYTIWTAVAFAGSQVEFVRSLGALYDEGFVAGRFETKPTSGGFSIVFTRNLREDGEILSTRFPQHDVADAAILQLAAELREGSAVGEVGMTIAQALERHRAAALSGDMVPERSFDGVRRLRAPSADRESAEGRTAVWNLAVAGRPVIVANRKVGLSWASSSAAECVWQEVACTLQANAFGLRALMLEHGPEAVATEVRATLDDIEEMWRRDPELVTDRLQRASEIDAAVQALRSLLHEPNGVEATVVEIQPIAIDRLCADEEAVRLVSRSRGVTGLVSQIPADNARWRLTVFDDDGAVGHIEYRTKREALTDASREGFEEAPAATASIPAPAASPTLGG